MDMKKLLSKIDSLNQPAAKTPRRARINEGKQLSECGDGAPAITMTAGTGSELASMFKDIIGTGTGASSSPAPAISSPPAPASVDVERKSPPSMQDFISIVDDSDMDSDYSDDVDADFDDTDMDSDSDDMEYDSDVSDTDESDLEDIESGDIDEEYANAPHERMGMDGVRKFGDVNNNVQNSLVGRSVNATYESLKAEYSRFISEACGIKSKSKATTESGKKKPSAGMTKGEKSKVVKKAVAGKDIGKPGKNFEKVEKAAKKGGAKDPKAVAAAAMWKNEAKKK